MTHEYSSTTTHWVLATAVLLLLCLQNSLSAQEAGEDVPCECEMKRQEMEIKDNNNCTAMVKLPVCQGSCFSSDYLKVIDDQKTIKVIQAPCCSATERKISPRALDFTCPDGSKKKERYFFPIALKCGGISHDRIGKA